MIQRLEDPNDLAAWGEFVDLYGATIIAWGKRLGLQDADAEDLAQEAFRRVVRSLPSYDSARGRFRGWLYTIVRNEFLRWQQRRQRQPAAVGGSVAREQLNQAAADVAERTTWDEEYDLSLLKLGLARLEQRLSPRNWRVFWATEMEGMPPQELAAQLGVSVGSIYVARSRALARLREIVQQIESEAELPV